MEWLKSEQILESKRIGTKAICLVSYGSSPFEVRVYQHKNLIFTSPDIYDEDEAQDIFRTKIREEVFDGLIA